MIRLWFCWVQQRGNSTILKWRLTISKFLLQPWKIFLFSPIALLTWLIMLIKNFFCWFWNHENRPHEKLSILQSLKTIFCAIILSHHDYCNLMLTSLPRTKLSKPQRVQNRSVRLVLGFSDSINKSIKDIY